MINIIECKTILDDASNLLKKGSDCVEIVKEITDKNADSYIPLERLVYNMKLVSDQLNSVKELFNTIHDTMIIACMMSVYAGKIEESGHWDEEDPDADSYPHINDYLKMAFEFDIPKNVKGDKIIDATQYQLYQMMKQKYYKENKVTESEEKFDIAVEVNHHLSIEQILSNVIKLLNNYSKCIYKINAISHLVNSADTSSLYDEEDINKCIKHIKTIPHIIRVALMAAVYAGNIEAAGWGFKEFEDADTISYLNEYLHIAEQYEIPIDDDGLYATDCVHTDISKIVHDKYNINNKSTDNNSET